MTDRITREHLEARIENLNRRMESRGATVRYQVQGRNGYIALDRFTRDPDCTLNLPDSVPGRGAGWIMVAHITSGTKREIAEYVGAMMVALDDSQFYGPTKGE